ncbi:uncharacterized protein [Scyliorhinus torazame]|uniref:uncharacterized protein isoform X3 n=1 Tax=Scyliorhinus torazame TaxID=75743 RepID=UPI003B5ADCAC
MCPPGREIRARSYLIGQLVKSSCAGTISQRMDPPTACVPWHSPPPIPSRQNMPSSIDLEQSVIYSASNQGPRSQKSGATSDQQSAFSQQVNHLQENRKAFEQCKALKEIARIVPHRVDRLYYICGSHIPIRPKYEVDMTALKRLQMKRSSQEATTAQEGRKGWVYEETEENESISSFEAQVVDPETQDNPNNKCCPRVTPVFMTENMEESQEAVQGKIQLSDGGSLGSVQEDEKTVEHLSSLGEESPAAAMSPECLNQVSIQ